ncbi:MAG: molybdenum cofactor biosynthesis protein MoaE [Candidatus Hodarchaeota archaeon]
MDSFVISKENALKLSDYLEKFRGSIDNHDGGAILTFTGIVREDSNPENASQKTKAIVIECIENMANEALNKIAREVEMRPGILKVTIIHATGQFSLGEPMVHVIVLGKHRKASFQAIQDAIDMYKSQAPLWKKEIYTDGSGKWISHE